MARMSNDATTQATRPNILVVDADPGNLDILRLLLHPHDNVQAAPSGADSPYEPDWSGASAS